VEFLTEKGTEMGSFVNDETNGDAEDFGKLDRTHELTWALLDDHISDAEMTELEQLLRTDKTARESYTRCMQLHADLAWQFTSPAQKSSSALPKGTPVLGFLNVDLPNQGMGSPATGESR
jgi:hypothetical protein